MTVPSLLLLVLLASPPSDETASVPETVQLTLQDAIRAAFANNFALQGALLDADATAEGFGASWGAFDTTWFASGNYIDRTTAPTPNNLVGGINVGGTDSVERDIFNLATGLRGQWETGTTWQFEVGADGIKTQSFDTTKTRTAEWGVSVTHPLLRGGANDYALSVVRLAAQDARIASVAAAEVANRTMTVVVTTYWNLVYAIQDVATRELSVELADELLGITRRKFQQGLQNRLDVIEVEAELANRQEELLTARNTHAQAMDDLRTAVLAPEDDALWAVDIQPATSYDIVRELEAVNLQESLAAALAYRPDVVQARLQLERADIEVERADNDTLPRLDVTGGYGLNSNERTAWAATRRLNDWEYQEARVSLDFELPLGNRTAEHTLRRRRLERERASVTLRETEVRAIADVRREARNVQLQLERVRATAETVRLRQEVYDGERRRLENDLSTPYLVREAQRDLLSAIDTETRARLDLAVARTALLAAEGRLLSRFGYRVEMPALSMEGPPPAP